MANGSAFRPNESLLMTWFRPAMQKTIFGAREYQIEFWNGTINGGSFSGEQLGYMYYGESFYYEIRLPGSPNTGTLQLRVYSLGTSGGGTQYGNRTINQYDGLILKYKRDLQAERVATFFLPSFATTAGSSILWCKTDGRTYRDGSFTNLGCGLVGTYQKSESAVFTESKTKKGYHVTTEFATFREMVRFKPRRYPREYVRFRESFTITNQRHATVTDWNFMPRYAIFFDDDNDGTYATTNWNGRIKSYGNISKSIKHWTGEFQVGNWRPTFSDADNELYGSMFGSISESRMKGFGLSAMIADKPLTFIPQFFGETNSFSWQDGMVSIDSKDKMKDLPLRNFVWDYVNIGSSANGKSWGVVKKVSGTEVMFDDLGDVKWIERKLPKSDIFSSIMSDIVGGIVGYVGAGWVGAGIGILNSIFNNSKSSSQQSLGYYRVTDYNAIPDHTVKSGVRLKFYSGSIDASATNLGGVLVGIKERVINSGRFDNGIYGTFGLDTTDGINIGDFIYVRKPMTFSGSPNQVIKGILCGSNIDYPYSSAGSYNTVGVFGSNILYRNDDFATNWDSELSTIGLMTVGKTIDANSETNPFNEIRELTADLQLSFFINEFNKFAVHAIHPRALLSSGTEVHYREGINILSGFSFNRSIEGAIAGIRMYYNFLGQGIGAFQNGYNALIEIPSRSPINGITAWGTIQSNWINNDEDAESIVYRALLDTQYGVDRVEIPTTLYGLINNVTDVVKVTHRTGSLTAQLFEIEAYNKQLDDSRVDITAVNVSRSYGNGNCLWLGTSQGVGTYVQSGYSVNGVGTSLRKVGTIGAVFNAWEGTMTMGGTLGLGNFSLQNNYILIGSLSSGFTEILRLQRPINLSGGNDTKTWLIGSRGMYNTIPRRYEIGENVYLLGAPNDIPFFSSVYNFGTTIQIGSNIGTTFKFF